MPLELHISLPGQVTQANPFTPHAAALVPDSHCPAALQQPLHVAGEQVSLSQVY
jgi:hypothetical protein